MEYHDFIEKIDSFPNNKVYCGGGLEINKAFAYEEGIFLLEIQYTGNMGHGLSSVDSEIQRVMGVNLDSLRNFSFSHFESGSPDYLWNGSYRIKI